MKPPPVLIKIVEAQVENRKANLQRSKDYRESQVVQLAETNTTIQREERDIAALEQWLRDAEVEAGE